jgi:hypothetical protein
MTTKTCILQAFCILLLASCTKNDNLSENIRLQKSDALVNEKNTITIKRDGKTYIAEKYKADYITDANSGQIGQTIYFKNVGNKQLGVEFVPGDPRRGNRTNITYAVDNETTADNGLDYTEVVAAIDAAMKTWDNAECSDLNMTKIPYNGNLGLFSQFLGFGGSSDIVADIQHSGFLPSTFFDAIVPGGGSYILAITIPYIWVDENGNPTDIDNNGKADYALAEIYYNDGFLWRTNSGSGVDLESIALHESGHGLGQAHFGKAFSNDNNGKLHFAPKAVMNAGYFGGEQRSLLGTDNGGHCSIWANWPNQ